jgi:hypothetical protein
LIDIGWLNRRGNVVQTVETSSPIEAQRCRRAQYIGRTAALTLNGSRIFGTVQSVRESGPQRWIVTIFPKVEKPLLFPERYKPLA